MEPNHICQDSGLRERPALLRLLTRHFAPLTVWNTANMRSSHSSIAYSAKEAPPARCTMSVCTQCCFRRRFDKESGESRLPHANRTVNDATVPQAMGSLAQRHKNSATCAVPALSDTLARHSR
ncbi:nitrogen fixation protein NifQ [Bradyrhizobium sp. DOA9]|uniref:nitrogen fixation protein NifQ n=1 Tax=Bradyrhizobium sp. DOA9 TaxID=1126627 RepID=UPI00404037A8